MTSAIVLLLSYANTFSGKSVPPAPHGSLTVTGQILTEPSQVQEMKKDRGEKKLRAFRDARGMHCEQDVRSGSYATSESKDR
jgi:hypothetical protein